MAQDAVIPRTKVAEKSSDEMLPFIDPSDCKSEDTGPPVVPQLVDGYASEETTPLPKNKVPSLNPSDGSDNPGDATWDGSGNGLPKATPPSGGRRQSRRLQKLRKEGNLFCWATFLMTVDAAGEIPGSLKSSPR